MAVETENEIVEVAEADETTEQTQTEENEGVPEEVQPDPR
jgi:hypothetical protein